MNCELLFSEPVTSLRDFSEISNFSPWSYNWNPLINNSEPALHNKLEISLHISNLNLFYLQEDFFFPSRLQPHSTDTQVLRFEMKTYVLMPNGGLFAKCDKRGGGLMRTLQRKNYVSLFLINYLAT